MDPTSLSMAAALTSLALFTLAIFRDRRRYGVAYCTEMAAAWALLFAVALVRHQISPGAFPLSGTALAATGLYIFVALITRGHPALLTAPYNEQVKELLSAKEAELAWRLGWVVIGAVMVGLLVAMILTIE